MCREFSIRPKPKFAHGAEVVVSRQVALIGSYHPSQQNTFTGTLTVPMFDAVFTRARRLCDGAT
jgi:uracil-DNA glycosylase